MRVLPNRLDRKLGAYVYGFVHHGYTEMNASEIARHNELDETCLRSAAQRGTVKSTTLALPNRVARTAEDWQVSQGISRYQQSQADVVRAAKNVLAWKEYLPNDCVKAMVASGWHFRV
jgi:hypothetical protein